MGEYDLVVAPYGDDSNEGSLDAPLRTFEKAKELLNNVASDTAVTVWFREGSYFIENTVEFSSSDKSNVLYRSYPNEEVSFTGAKPISDWTETEINGVKAFVADVPIDSEEDYFYSASGCSVPGPAGWLRRDRYQHRPGRCQEVCALQLHQRFRYHCR
jgi:hypothetical protein